MRQYEVRICFYHTSLVILDADGRDDADNKARKMLNKGELRPPVSAEQLKFVIEGVREV